jgi:hypothetical protein
MLGWRRFERPVDMMMRPFLLATMRALAKAQVFLLENLYVGRSSWSANRSAREAKRVVYRESLYNKAVTLFEGEKFSQAARVFKRYVKSANQADLLAARNTWRVPQPRWFASFERKFSIFLDERNNTWSEGGRVLPTYLQTNSRHPDERINARMRMLFLFPEFINVSSTHVECNFKDFFFQSAVNAGVDASYFFTDRISYTHLQSDPHLANRDLLALREKVAAMRPDVIFFDANFPGGDLGLTCEFLSDLKAEFNFRTIGYLGDAWGDYWASIADYWTLATDLMMHVAPGGGAEQKSSNSNIFFCSPCPLNRLNFYPTNETTNDLSFVGSYGSYLRPFWLTYATMEAQRLNLRYYFNAHQRTNKCPTMAEYGAIVRQSQIVLNFSSRLGNTKAITARPWEVLNAGRLLLEEENDPIKHFFVPFVHYVPFENVRQLRYFIRFFTRHPEVAQRIGRNAVAFCDEHYSAASIWARLFERLFT